MKHCVVFVSFFRGGGVFCAVNYIVLPLFLSTALYHFFVIVVVIVICTFVPSRLQCACGVSDMLGRTGQPPAPSDGGLPHCAVPIPSCWHDNLLHRQRSLLLGNRITE